MAHAQYSTRRAMLAVTISLTLPLLAACKEDSSTGPRGNSSRLAFTSDRDGNLEIYSANADGSDVRRLTTNPATQACPTCGDDSDPSWSSTGRIAFTSTRDGNSEIYSMNADGSDVRRLTNNAGRDELPAWSPNGSHIAFASNRDGNIEIYMMNANGSSPTRLTNNSASDLFASWAPDGQRFAFHSNRDGNFEIYTSNVDGTGLARLTTNTVFDQYPMWSTDGKRIAFHSNRDGNFEVYTMAADGTGVLRVTNNAAFDVQAAWRP
jgi:Tol biopolymer transport system component